MSAPSAFSVEEPRGQRFGVALELLREGKTIEYRGVELSLRDPTALDCGVVTQWYSDIPQTIAQEELRSGKEIVDALVAESPAFAELIAGRRLRFSLITWDGMGYTELARLEET